VGIKVENLAQSEQWLGEDLALDIGLDIVI
jgi:hypothetical protein